MSAKRLYVFDDRVARRWAPFTLTRPVGELLLGTRTLGARAAHALGLPLTGHLSRRALVGFDEPGAAPVVELEGVASAGTRVLLSSRAALRPLERDLPEEPARLVLDGETVGWIAPEGAALPSEEALRDPASAPPRGPDVHLEGELLERPWNLVEANPRWIRADAELQADRSEPEGVVRIGEGAVSLSPGAAIEPGVVLDTRNGPILLDEGARVEGPSRLAGPLYLGPDTLVFGGPVGSSSIGPRCKVRGELVDSVLIGFANKAHDGHLGHALVGRWVNLGAGTTNSDLKNNYGSVRVWTPEGEVDTGLMKVGCLLGDHVKSAIGTMLGTGTVVEAGGNLFGDAVPTYVPPFAWGAEGGAGTYRIDKLLETAERAMARRDQTLTPGVRRILEEAWSAAAGGQGGT